MRVSGPGQLLLISEITIAFRACFMLDPCTPWWSNDSTLLETWRKRLKIKMLEFWPIKLWRRQLGRFYGQLTLPPAAAASGLNFATRHFLKRPQNRPKSTWVCRNYWSIGWVASSTWLDVYLKLKTLSRYSCKRYSYINFFGFR